MDFQFYGRIFVSQTAILPQVIKRNYMTKIITRASVMNFWTREINSGRESYKDECGEKDYTKMGEQASQYFSIASDNGQSDIEIDIFEWATEMVF